MIQKIYCGENQISIEQKLQNDYGNGGEYISRHPNATKQEILAERDRIEKKVFGNTKGDL